MSFWKTFAAEEKTSNYNEAIQKTAAMAEASRPRRLAKEHGLDIVNLTWEDTGRFKGSAVGPNISDMTIQVRDDRGRPSCMPVIRYPNFTDKTADVALDEIFLRVGNERGEKLKRVSLRHYLGDLRHYLSKPRSWKGSQRSLLAPRDRDVLVSAQACFLPVPKEGKAEFNPVLFNYQSRLGAPAVLAIMISREGTSATIIDNLRDSFSSGSAWGQRLFFNLDGERASFTGTRLAEFEGDATSSADDKSGLNEVLLVQVPLVQPKSRRASSEDGVMYSLAAPSCGKSSFGSAESDVEEAVIGHGEVEGPFTEIDDLAIDRDTRFPIRVTVQFYKATSNGEVSADDISEIAAQIESVYSGARAIGSLVVGGNTGRSTEHDGPKHETPGFWNQFWAQRERDTGKTKTEALKELERLLGYRPKDDEVESALRKIFGRS